MFGRCKSGENCSYLHITESNNFLILKALKEEIIVLKNEIDKLRERNCEIEAKVERLDRSEPSKKDETDKVSFKNILICDQCDYEASTMTVLKRHKTMKHKETSSTASSSTAITTQPSIPCAREEEGYTNFVHEYFSKYTAICSPCRLIISEMMKSSPFPPTACPCCHQPSSGHPFSFCEECLSCLQQDGYMESGW